MINVDPKELSELVRQSDNYKLMERSGWLYVVPASVTDSYIEDWDDEDFLKLSVLAIDHEGRVVSSRYGPVYLADDPAIQSMQYR